MMFQSIGIGNRCLTVIFPDRQREELKRCPFSECCLYHAEGLEVCDTTGKSIVEEVKRQREKARREELAGMIRVKYLSKNEDTWQPWAAIGGSILVLVELGYFFGIVAAVVGVFIWILPWIVWGRRRWRRIKVQADDIHQRVLNGEEVKV